jgi:uncharacterized protein
MTTHHPGGDSDITLKEATLINDGSPTLPPARWGLRDMLFAGITAVLLVILGVIAAVVATVLLWPRLGLPQLSQNAQVWLIFALEAVLILPAWWWGPRKYGGGWAGLGLRRFPILRSVVLCIGGFIAILAINIAWDSVRQRMGLAGQPNYLPLFGQGVRGLIMALLLGSVVAPVAEEVFFRGFLYAGLRARWGVGWGLCLSALIFAVVHLIPGVLPPIFIMGLLFAWLYETTASIWPGIALHGAVNAMAFLAVYLVEKYPQLAPLAK